jgi:hypothetical protein
MFHPFTDIQRPIGDYGHDSRDDRSNDLCREEHDSDEQHVERDAQVAPLQGALIGNCSAHRFLPVMR